MQRVFLAVPIPEKTKLAVGREIERLKKSLFDWNISWLAPENLHITLVFFGWVQEEKIEILKTEIAAAGSGFAPFEIATGKLSLKGQPLWLEIGQGRKEIQRIVEKLAKELTIKGSPEEERSFHSHLTLGRVKKCGKSRLPAVSASFSWKTDRLILYESKFIRKQRVYQELFPFPLKER